MKKRIAIICPSVGLMNRGAETFIMEITKALKSYYDIDIYTRGMDESVREHIVQVSCEPGKWLELYNKIYTKSKILKRLLNCTRYLYFFMPNVLYQRKISKYIFRHIMKRKYDVLFPYNGIMGAIEAKKYAKLNKIPVIYIDGGGIGPNGWWILKTKPDMYICKTEKHLRWAQRYYKNVALIHNGTYVDRFLKEDFIPYVINKNHKLVISVGALVDFKRHHLTIAALSKMPEVDLLIMGDGENKEMLLQLGTKMMPGRMKIESVNYMDMPRYYHSADLFVLPSLNEPFGIVYVEALASNLPIVAPDDETRREIIGDSGLYCNVEDEQEYRECILEALNKEWGTLPREQARKYDYSVIGEQYHNLIEAVC